MDIVSKMSTNEMMTRVALGKMLGKSFHGKRDVYEAFGYSKDISYDDYLLQYRRHDIAKALIKRPSQDTWAGELIVTEHGTEEDTPLETAWKEMEDKLKLKTKFARLDRLSALGTFGVLLMGFSDCKNNQSFVTEVKKKKDLELLYIKPIGQGSVKIESYVTNAGDERFGMPKIYSIELNSKGNSNDKTLKVHHSRVIHVAWDLMEDENEGTPVMEAVFNRLKDLEKLVGGSAEMFWRGARPGYQGIIGDDFSLSESAQEAIKKNIDDYESGLRRFFMHQGVKLEDLAPQVSDPTNHVKVQIQMISAVTGIPQRILMGSERGELASGQDADAWRTLITNRRTEQVEPTIVRPFVDRMLELGIFPPAKTGSYDIVWSDLFAPSEKERAETGKTRAISLSEYAKMPLASEIMPPDLFAKFFLGFTEEQILLVNQMRKKAMEEEDAFARQYREDIDLEGEIKEEEKDPKYIEHKPPKDKEIREEQLKIKRTKSKKNV